MELTLNTTSGVLHSSARCAGQDTRFHYHFTLADGEKLLGFMYYRLTGLCQKCVRVKGLVQK